MNHKLNKFRKIFLVLAILITGFISTQILFPESLYPVRVNMSSWASSVDKNGIKKANISHVNIMYDDKVATHFNELYKMYSGNTFPDNVLDQYKLKNTWQEATVAISGKKHDALVKNHGQSPIDHKKGGHYSLGVKFKNKPYPFFSKRVNFVIYNRIQLTNSIVKMMSSKMGLLCPNFETTCVTIGNNKPSLYYVEERINKEFFKKRNLPMLNSNKGGKVTETRKQDLVRFSSAIKNGNTSFIKQHINLDYMSNLQAFRIIYGCDGHGFNVENMELAYDTIQRKFYPIVHRDVHNTHLIARPEEHNPLFKTLENDSVFQQLTREKISLFLKTYKVEDIQNELDSIRELYQKLFNFNFTYINNGYDGSSLVENMKMLNAEMKEAQ